jgi:transposase
MAKEIGKKGIIKMGTGLPVLNHHAAGIDIGDTIHYVAVNGENGGYEVKSTQAYTCDLKEIVEYLKSHGITTAAMESTGVYWVPLYLLLEEAGIDVYLVNARHVKNVTGRKKDDTDAIWIQKLHTCGLLQKSFQPEEKIRLLRNYTRQRKKLIEIGSQSVRRMQKALELMNIKIHTVISDILGKTGMRIVKAILEGERDPEVLAELCDRRIKASKAEIMKSLDGVWSEEQLFFLGQSLDAYEFNQKQIKSCEEKIQKHLLNQVAKLREGDITDIVKGPEYMTRKGKKNQVDFNMEDYLEVIAGVDLTKLDGIGPVTALEFISEVGLDMTKWKDGNYFAAWLNLTPNTKITGGKIISSRMMKKKNRGGLILRQAASGLLGNKSPIGDFYRRARARIGGKGAVIATAHKLAKILFMMILTKTEYRPEILIQSQAKDKAQKIRRLEKQLERLKNTA